MPYSSTSGKLWTQRYIQRLIKKCKNNSIFDVGAGAGTYSNYLRSKLKDTLFEGLEIWEPYITQYNLHSKYDRLFVEDAREFIPDRFYGITILGDVLEHMTAQEAVQVYNKMLDSSEFVLISIPIIHYPQGAIMGNPYETHVKEDWTHQQVIAAFRNLALYQIEKEIGIYVGYNPTLHTYDEAVDAKNALIAVYGIYKNEQKHMERFLNSVKNADEIILGDTGSTDDTNRIISRFKEKNPDTHLNIYKINSSPFRLDDDRNKTLSFIDKGIDLCISLNIDEYLMEGWKEYLVKGWKFGYTGYFHRLRTYLPSGEVLEYWDERIHSREGYAWKYPVHEILEFSGEEIIKRLPDFWLIHQPE